jgi:hypothetical protein
VTVNRREHTDWKILSILFIALLMGTVLHCWDTTTERYHHTTKNNEQINWRNHWEWSVAIIWNTSGWWALLQDRIVACNWNTTERRSQDEQRHHGIGVMRPIIVIWWLTTPIRNQANCGSATLSHHSDQSITHNKTRQPGYSVDLSEQSLSLRTEWWVIIYKGAGLLSGPYNFITTYGTLPVLFPYERTGSVPPCSNKCITGRPHHPDWWWHTVASDITNKNAWFNMGR